MFIWLVRHDQEWCNAFPHALFGVWNYALTSSTATAKALDLVPCPELTLNFTRALADHFLSNMRLYEASDEFGGR